MHAVKERPVVVNGQIVIRPIMVVALTYDHRLLDGREAVTFLGAYLLLFSVVLVLTVFIFRDVQSRSATTSRTPGRCSLLATDACLSRSRGLTREREGGEETVIVVQVDNRVFFFVLVNNIHISNSTHPSILPYISFCL